jgi:transcriptional regulator GlxA family with amidase domain
MSKWLLAVTVLFAIAALAPRVEAALVPPKDRPLKVAVVLTDGATMIDFAGPWEVFQDVGIPARDGSKEETNGFELYTVGAANAPIKISAGMTVVPDYAFADAPTPDIVLVGAQRGAPELAAWLKRMRGVCPVVMSVCTGAFKLGDAGILDGKKATTHHDYYDQFAKKFPNVTLVRSTRFVQTDDVVFTAGGLTSGIDLALHIVDLYYGRAVAEKTAKYMEYESVHWHD